MSRLSILLLVSLVLTGSAAEAVVKPRDMPLNEQIPPNPLTGPVSSTEFWTEGQDGLNTATTYHLRKKGFDWSKVDLSSKLPNPDEKLQIPTKFLFPPILYPPQETPGDHRRLLDIAPELTIKQKSKLKIAPEISMAPKLEVPQQVVQDVVADIKSTLADTTFAPKVAIQQKGSLQMKPKMDIAPEFSVNQDVQMEEMLVNADGTVSATGVNNFGTFTAAQEKVPSVSLKEQEVLGDFIDPDVVPPFAKIRVSKVTVTPKKQLEGLEQKQPPIEEQRLPTTDSNYRRIPSFEKQQKEEIQRMQAKSVPPLNMPDYSRVPPASVIKEEEQEEEEEEEEQEEERKLYYHKETQQIADKLASRPSYVLPDSVKIDIDAYTGVWFETHRSKVPSMTFEKDLQCVTANYAAPKPRSFLGIFNDVPTISVTQGGRRGAPDGEEKTSNPTLWQFDPTNHSGKLAYTMPNKILIGGYYVYKVGPKDKRSGKYKWAVVTDDVGLMVWILTREPWQPTQHIVDMLDEEGFNKSWHTLMPTYQGPDCMYPDYVYSKSEQ